MEKPNHIEDYTRTFKVLDSCQTMDHIKGAVRYFNLCITKWKDSIPEEIIPTMKENFEDEVSHKISLLYPESVEK